MYKISKTFTFAASHQILELPEDHKCRRLHGHNYSVTVHLRSESLDEFGFVTDYGNLKPIKDLIDSTYDHRHLNDIISTPTAELLAYHFYDVFKPLFPQIYAITVKESDATSSTYEEMSL